MVSFLLNAATVIGSVILGVGGWVVAHFVGAPIRDFYQCRRAVHEALVAYANVEYGISGSVGPLSRTEAAAEAYRKLASQLDAFHATAGAVPNLYWHLRGFRLEAAAGGLRGLSNSMKFFQTWQRLAHRNAVEKGLKLPRSYSDQQVADCRRAAERRVERDE